MERYPFLSDTFDISLSNFTHFHSALQLNVLISDPYPFSHTLSHTQWQLHQEFGGIFYFGLVRKVELKENKEGDGGSIFVSFVDINSKASALSSAFYPLVFPVPLPYLNVLSLSSNTLRVRQLKPSKLSEGIWRSAAFGRSASQKGRKRIIWCLARPSRRCVYVYVCVNECVCVCVCVCMSV